MLKIDKYVHVEEDHQERVGVYERLTKEISDEITKQINIRLLNELKYQKNKGIFLDIDGNNKAFYSTKDGLIYIKK